MQYFTGINDLQQLKWSLEKDLVRNGSILGFIENNPVTEIVSEGNSYLVKGISDRKWIYFSSKSEDEFRTLLTRLSPSDKCFASVEDWMIPEIVKSGEIDWQLIAMRYYLPLNVVIPENKIEINRLKKKDAEYIRDNSNYKQFLPEEYLKQRIEQSFSAGIVEDNKLVAWSITHDDGAIGALHVLDEHRKKGYAAEIVIYMSRKIRIKGRIPIAQIEEKNSPAIKLFGKLGFVKDRIVTWLMLK
jgi:8-oxo-dGTP diphosphatase